MNIQLPERQVPAVMTQKHPLGKVLAILLLTALTASNSSAQNITTIAGGFNGDGKTATSIGLSSADAMIADANENLYFLDRSQNTIRRIDAVTKMITTIAGGGTAFVTEGAPALSVGLILLQFQNGMAFDSQGHLYFISGGGIFRLDLASGLIHIVVNARTSTGSGDGGPISLATVTNVRSLACDQQDNLYFTDYNRIRMVSAMTGIVNTIAGNGTLGFTGDGGPAVNAELAGPIGIALDRNGNLFVADNNNYVIRKIVLSTGIITTIAGSQGVNVEAGDGGPAISADLSSPSSIATDASGNLYLCSTTRIRAINATTGVISAISSTGGGVTGDGSTAINTTIYNTSHLTVSPAGNIYFDDNLGQTIRKIATGTTLVSTVGGNGRDGVSGIPGPALAAQLFSPMNLTADRAGNVFIVDDYNNAIYRIDKTSGQIQNLVNVASPMGIAVDGAGNVYYTRNSGMNVVKMTPSGATSIVAGSTIRYGHTGDGGPATAATLNDANGLALDAAGNLYIADIQNNCIRKVTAATGIITTIAGTTVSGYTGDGSPATTATLNSPFGVTVDRPGNVYVVDNGNNVVRKIDAATGIISTVAGTGIAGFSGDNGLATAAQLNYPYRVITDSLNNLYISDQFNQRIRKVDVRTGIITTFAGNGQSAYSGDNVAANTTAISNPVGIGFDSAYNLYVNDWTNNRIRMIANVLASPPLIPTGIMTGIVFYDDNGNGIRDAGEAAADSITASAVTGSTRLTTTTKNGIFKLQADTGSYTVSVDSLPYYSITPASRPLHLVADATYDSVSFALQPIAGKQDLQVALLPLSPSRPGFPLQFRLFYRNIGTVPVNNVTLGYTGSNKAFITSTLPLFDSLSADSATAFWRLGTLNPHQAGSVEIHEKAYAPPIANIGDYLHFVATINPITGDLNPADDTARLTQSATGAYDPNEKTEVHQGTITPAQLAAGEWLDYTIRFQNTGNDTAFTVIVKDTLDAKLAWPTLLVTETSHNYQLVVDGGNKLTFTFSNILLPDSLINPAASEGFIHFRIRPLPTLTAGTDITGRSSIYFDANPPVLTNTVHTIIGNLPVQPPKPTVANLAANYCSAAGQQPVSLSNLPAGTSAWVKIDGVPQSLTGAGVVLTPAQLTAGNNTFTIGYTNAAGESRAQYPFTITPASTPVVTVAADNTVVGNLSAPVLLTATSKSGGGFRPLFIFAKDRNFTNLVQAESSANTVSLQSSALAVGENWYYVRMKTSDSCFTKATAVDSIKLTRKATAGGFTDPDNPGVEIIGYPNPVTRQMTLTGLSDQKSYEIAIYNSIGVRVQTFIVTGTQTRILSTAAWPAGNYWIGITDIGRNTRLGQLHVSKL
jgi:uncharacterized repeat protein (TIGR01451 family)